MTYDNISSQYQNYRRIALIVVHCSATRADRSFPVEALRRCHVQERGFADIGYHFYITRDGITHVCRPIDHIGSPCPLFQRPQHRSVLRRRSGRTGTTCRHTDHGTENRADSTVAATSAGLSRSPHCGTQRTLYECSQGMPLFQGKPGI